MRVLVRRLLWVALVPGAVLAAAYYCVPGGRASSAQSVSVPAFTLEELCRDELADGWRIKHLPDLSGPYQRRAPGWLYYHPGSGGPSTVRLHESSGAVVWEEQTRPGVDFLTVVLVTSDGRRTEGLLVRGE